MPMESIVGAFSNWFRCHSRRCLRETQHMGPRPLQKLTQFARCSDPNLAHPNE